MTLRALVSMIFAAAALSACGGLDHCFYTDDNQTCSVVGRRMP